ncbi:hypothetical protein [Methylopila sp. M107]|uniref:hypothetical protein n=1 Tax=Methylopila sp. M107 TaxID=1101190 RepID=UPI000367D787|nr:hypothetical protein [Methylopila sp. M107]
MVEPRKSRAGTLLYRQLPEEYRYRDNRAEDERGDLEAYLDGFGHFLDRVRETLEQSYADAFAETADNDRTIQDWLVPYLAELLSAELQAPDPSQRPAELNETVGWYKGKGTLGTLDSLSDTVAGAETVVVEGWRRTLVTPRNALPPFTMPPGAAGDGDPWSPAAVPLGTPDLRKCDRAVLDPAGTNPLRSFALPKRDAKGLPVVDTVHWKQLARGGAPCFPGHFDDMSVRTPDIGDFSRRAAGPHPRRIQVHVQPPSGLFEAGLKVVTLAGADPLAIGAHGSDRFSINPREVYRQYGIVDPVPDGHKIVIAGDLTVPANADVALSDLLFTGKITVTAGATLELRRSAAKTLVLAGATDAPMLSAHDCLFQEILGPASFALLEYVTVLGETTLGRLWASDCLFVGDLVDFDCGKDGHCVRYSRLPASLVGPCVGKGHPNNTIARPAFVELWSDDPAGDCVLAPAAYGEPGCGVLASNCSSEITEGAEDRGEMGAHHHLFHAAKLRAIRLKMKDFLPVGQSISVAYDERLALRPPKLA